MTDTATRSGLDEGELRTVDDTLARLDAEASPGRLRILGWFLTIAGSVTLLVMPMVGPAMYLGREATLVVTFLAAAIFIAGIGGLLLSRRFVKQAPAKRAALQLERLASGQLTDDQVIAAAVRLLVSSRTTRSTATTFEVSRAAKRLGDRLEQVREVELELIARGQVLPVFTTRAEW